MREIKFRGWNGKELVDFYKITPLALDTTLKQDGLFIPFGDDIPLMQYTGLRDKNGVEIYEGDIVQPYMGGEKVEPVAVSYDAPRFNMDEVWYHDVEVIGNIHENPELLK